MRATYNYYSITLRAHRHGRNSSTRGGVTIKVSSKFGSWSVLNPIIPKWRRAATAYACCRLRGLRFLLQKPELRRRCSEAAELGGSASRQSISSRRRLPSPVPPPPAYPGNWRRHPWQISARASGRRRPTLWDCRRRRPRTQRSWTNSPSDNTFVSHSCSLLSLECETHTHTHTRV